MLNEEEYQDPTDDRLSPVHRRPGASSDEPDDLSPEKVDAMEQDASGSSEDALSPQEKAEKDSVSSQVSEEPDFFNQSNEGGGGGRFRASFTSKRKKATISLAAILLVGGGFGLIGFLQGPAQLLRLDSALKKPESAQNATVSTRLRRMLFRSALKNGDDRLLLARSRLGTTQNRVFGGMLDRLEARHGITFTEESGIVTGRSRPTMVFDLPDGHPLRGRTGTITRLNVARALGIDASKIPNLDGVGNNGRFSVKLDLSRAELDGVKSWLAHNTGGGSVTRLNSDFAVAVNKRMFAKTLRLPSIFHPITRVSDAVGTKLDNLADKGAARRTRKQANAESRRSAKVEERKSSARSELKSKVGGNVVKTAGAAIAVQGVMCMIKDIAGIVPKVYYATVVMPSVIKGVQTQAAISQILAGEATNEQVGDLMADFEDSSGGTIWGGKALNALDGGGAGEGTDIDVGAKAAFTTNGSSIAGLTAALGFDEVAGVTVSDSVAGWACSSVARLGGLVVGVAITVGGIVSGVVTGGTTTAGAVGRVAVQAALAGTVSYAVSRILGEFVDGKVKDKVADVCGVEFDSGESDTPEDIEVLNAEAYGNCLAYAARMSSNINAASMGGVPISSSDEQALLNQTNEKEIAEFKKKGLFERLFSTKDSRSMLMTALRPATETKLSVSSFASVVTGLFKKPTSIVSSSLSALTPSASAVATTYDWGFPLVAMPESIADDPQYDSVENVKWITDNRASVDADRVKKCFGKQIVGEGAQLRAVLLEDEINPLSDDYNNANCGDLSNPDWVRTALFVMDDSIAAAMDCYDGAKATCEELGLNNSGDVAENLASAENLNCEGYDILTSKPAVIADGQPTNVTQRRYSESIKALCGTRKSECIAGTVAPSQRALCGAFEFDGVYYGSTSYDTSGLEFYGFQAATNALSDPVKWYSSRQPGLNPYNVLECSALTTAAVYRAFNHTSKIGCSSTWTQRTHPELFREITASEILPGDFLTRTPFCVAPDPNSDNDVPSHIAIAASTVDADGNIVVYHSSGHGSTVHFQKVKLSFFLDTGGRLSRWIGPTQ